MLDILTTLKEIYYQIIRNINLCNLYKKNKAKQFKSS